MKIIAAVGKNGCGKDAMIERIASRFGIPMFSIGDIARDLAQKKGIEPTRENLHKISAKYMSTYGRFFFPDQIIRTIQRQRGEFFLVSGIRPYSDIDRFKEAFGDNFILINVVVHDDKDRFRRMLKRQSGRDPETFEEFLEQDRLEERLFGISRAEKAADWTIVNDGTLEEFYEKVDPLAEKLLRSRASQGSPAMVPQTSSV